MHYFRTDADTAVTGPTSTDKVFLGGVFKNDAGAAASFSVYDGADNTGPRILLVSVPSNDTKVVMLPGNDGITCKSGIYVDVPASGDCTILWR
jgi:hypothetical protein